MAEYANEFRDLVVWQKSHELALLTYKLTAKYPSYEIYGLVSQMRRAAVSVPSNIAEGFGRKNKKESLQFYHISRGSLRELDYQYQLSLELKYINDSDFERAKNLTNDVSRLLRGWINKN